jgi:hypothetical protein
MSASRRKHDPAFKAKVALSALRGSASVRSSKGRAAVRVRSRRVRVLRGDRRGRGGDDPAPEPWRPRRAQCARQAVRQPALQDGSKRDWDHARALAVELGITLSARARLRVTPPKAKDPFETFLDGDDGGDDQVLQQVGMTRTTIAALDGVETGGLRTVFSGQVTLKNIQNVSRDLGFLAVTFELTRYFSSGMHKVPILPNRP